MLGCTSLHAQQTEQAIRKGEAIREKMLRAYGGEKYIKNIKLLEYSVIDVNYHTIPTVSTRTAYRLDLKNQQITSTTEAEGTTIVKSAGKNGAWQEINGIRSQLAPEEQEALEHIFFLNHLAMLQQPQLRYEYVLSCQYKGHAADVVLVSNPLQPGQQANLFVSSESGKVLSSSWPKQLGDGLIQQYTDLLEYRPFGRKLTYPVEYQVHINGELASEGRIVDMKIR